MKAIPLVAALLGAVFIAAYDLLWYVDPGLPAVKRFWLHTTAGGVLTFGVTVAVGVLVARWWAVAMALAIIVGEAALIVADAPLYYYESRPPPLEAPLVVAKTLLFAVVLAAGVAVRKLVAKLAAPRTTRAT